MKTRGDPRPPILTPALAVDAVLLHRGRVLLVRRAHPPFEGHWSFPGGFVQVGERTERAVVRELKEETGVAARVLGVVGVYSDPRRDPRGHNVAVAYALRPSRHAQAPRGGDDAREARWWPIDSPPPLAFDHEDILRDALAPGPGARRGTTRRRARG